MWLLGQIVFYLLGAFIIGAAGSWVLRGRLADDSHEHLRQRFRQMVSSSEMERDAAKLRVRELSVEVRTLEEQFGAIRERGDAEAPEDRGSTGAAPGEPSTDVADLDPADQSAELVDPPADDVSVTDSGGGEQEDVNAVARMAPAVANGVLTDAAEIDVTPSDEPLADATTLPESPKANGGGVPYRFQLAQDPSSSEPDESVPPQDTVLAHTWASADAAANQPLAAATPPATGTPPNGRPFSDLGDIAPTTSEQLRSMGIHNTSDLNRHFRSGANPSELAQSLDVEVRKVRRWRVLSELMEVPQVGPESAWLLEISGLASVGELAAEDPGELASRMAALNADQGLGLPVPDRAVVASWVQWASSSQSPQSAGP